MSRGRWRWPGASRRPAGGHRAAFLRATAPRGKIAAGYVLSLALLLLIASILFVQLLVVEDQVSYFFGVSRFLDSALEMRRYEKNFFLYRQPEDLREAMRYADAATAQLGGPPAAGEIRRLRRPGRWWLPADPDRLSPDLDPERTRALLQGYADLLRRAAEGGPGTPEATAAEASVREQGRRITEIAERLSEVEGGNIQKMLQTGRRTLVLLVVLFLAGMALVARVVLLTFRDAFQHRQEQAQAERLAALGTALAGIAHEINNPLSNISTSAEILREENDRSGPGERRELIDQILSQTDRATDIIRSVLDFSRDAPLDRQSTNLLSAVRGSLTLVSGDLPSYVAVTLDVPPDLAVRADKTKLEQAFVNLLANAIDALRERSRSGRIAVSAQPSGEGTVEISFQDTGAGIPPAALGRIFDPFFTTKDVGQGTGLGLYLTHQIVEQHGGSIRVESTVGEGTLFVVRLPGAGGRRAQPGEAVARVEGESHE